MPDKQNMMTLPQLEEHLSNAVTKKVLLPESRDNILAFLRAASNPLYFQSVSWLVEMGLRQGFGPPPKPIENSANEAPKDHWKELNDRFFKKLKFGTSGLRGRTIGAIVTDPEKGAANLVKLEDRPEFPCVGTNAMNYFNLNRATRGLIAFLKKHLAETRSARKPRVIFSHDTRHFSREFAEYCAKICTDLGVDVWLFSEHRATPQLSYMVRQQHADAGIMCTASHNPYHDNGYKVYFNDGSSILDPIPDKVLEEMNLIDNENYAALPEAKRGKLSILQPSEDDAYVARLKNLLLDPDVLKKARELKIVYTALHGCGGVLVPRLLKELGFETSTVATQDTPDGAFPTVKSPNPEDPKALQKGRSLADEIGADIVIGTDPDCDRMGVMARGADGELAVLTGNQIGSLMAWYRVEKFFARGILNESNRRHAVVVKTYVTTDLQKAICERRGIRCVETLTGFKYIGAKLGKYESSLPPEIQVRYRMMSDEETRDAHLQHGSFFVFGGEESYGYLGSDFIRDKDGNGAVVMLAEIAAYAKSRNLTLIQLMDEIYLDYGYYYEFSYSKEFPGADGNKTMQQLMVSYTEQPPTSIGGLPVIKLTHFGLQNIYDAELDLVPKENLLIADLGDGTRFAVRPSGTEPKIKYYFFSRKLPTPGKKLEASELPSIKENLKKRVEALWKAINADIDRRIANR